MNDENFIVELSEEQQLGLDKCVVYCQKNGTSDSENLTRMEMLQRIVNYVLEESVRVSLMEEMQ